MQVMRVRAAQEHHAFELRVQKPLLCGIGSKGQLCCGKLRFRRDSTERRGDAVRVFIVMGNVNAIAVASLADTAGIILVEDAVLDADAKARAEQQEIAVYGTSLPAFETALKIASLLG